MTHSTSSPRSTTPTPSDSLTGRHLIYRGLTKSSMEYMSLSHSNRHPEAAHTLKGEILISGKNQPGYIQYNITLDQEWMTRRVILTAVFDGSQEKRLVLEVDQDQRWYKVTEHRLARSRSFFRSGVNSPANNVNGTATTSSSPRPSNLGRDTSSTTTSEDSSSLSRVSSESLSSASSMQDVDTSFSDVSSYCSSSSFSSSSSDVESSIPFEKINLTWTPPPKGTKRGSKRFSSFNPLKDVHPSLSSSPPSATNSCATTNFSASSPPQQPPTVLRSPVIEFANRTLSKSSSSSSLNGSSSTTQKTYEHIPSLDGCIHLDLGSDISPSTLLLPVRRATLGIDPDEMRDHLASLMSCPSAVTSELTAMVSFPDLSLRRVRTHVAYVGQGSDETLSIVERWTDEDDDDLDSTLVEVDEDGLVVRYGDAWARLRTC
ncbi:hypothetical protein BGZ80_009798 [Entomortierella chlamydospora]|uniref:Uncharacterized protein n=1 Tax=Entomortierella chlamydospora TaxID=101097 RepID=A0A9P6T0U5_9FUNG|nr:hypothetical protein BGZ79_010930 [Entomortierella chlamydospora]KAG0015531.1 hypothetical protein BGZ80_009798 [Entomortierella chlamydospora]